MRRSAAAPWRPSPATVRLLIQAAALAVFGVGFESAFGALEARIPREIHRAPSFTWGLLESRPLFWLPALLALGLAGWSLTAAGRRRIGWSRFDDVGLRWVTFGIMLALAWPYGAHPYNHYFDQAHLLDRALLLFFLGATLHSPLWLPFFALEVVMSRVQTLHPVSLVTPIVDEVPFRVLGVIAGFGLWSFAAAELSERVERRRRGGVRLPAIEVHVLVFAMLCLFASYYVYAGVGKLALGEQPFDWVAESHMDNLFIGAYLNGWNASLSEPTALALAGWVRQLSIPIAATSLALEVGMLFVLTGRRQTLAILAGIIGMHLGVLAVTGVFFWTWALVAACVLAWLIVQRNTEAVRRLHAPPHAVLSVALIAALTFAFGWDPFSWWNSKFSTRLELDAVDPDGRVRPIDYAVFSPYLLIDFWEPYAGSIPGWYGGTPFQSAMRRLEGIGPEALEASNDARWAAGRGPTRRDPALDEFVQRFFQNRNRNLARWILALPPPPTIRIRRPRSPTPYEGDSQVVEVRVRYVEAYYTGSAIVPLRDTIVHTIRIPRDGNG